MFDPQAYQRWDTPGKEAISGHLTALGFQVIESGKYDIDLSVSGSGRVFNVDVEVRPILKWNEDFPFPEVQFPARKTRHSGDNNWLVMLNPYLTRGVVYRADKVASSTAVQKDCGRDLDEAVLSVPLAMGKEFSVISKISGDTSTRETYYCM